MPRRYPTSEEINALPPALRRYIRDLECRYDPAGELQERAALEMQVGWLVERVRESEGKSEGG